MSTAAGQQQPSTSGAKEEPLDKVGGDNGPYCSLARILTRMAFADDEQSLHRRY